MALTDKLSAIADAIRAKTGKAGKLTLPQMVTEISSIPAGITPSGSLTILSNGTYDVTDKATAVVSVPLGSTNCKCVQVTVAEEKTEKFFMTSADPDIAAHRSDENFYAGIIPLFPYSSGPSIRGGINTNHNLIENAGNPVYGFLMRTNSSGSNSFAFITKGATAAGGEISTTASGEIFFYASSTYRLTAGNYLVFCGWN